MPKRRAIAMFTTSEGKQYPFKMHTRASAKTVLRPYALELGLLANAWNQLHFNLSCLFVLLVNAANVTFSKAIWYATDSDFTQRKMLRSIIEADQNVLPNKRKLSKVQANEIDAVLDGFR
jgi:hypothetical protein